MRLVIQSETGYNCCHTIHYEQRDYKINVSIDMKLIRNTVQVHDEYKLYITSMRDNIFIVHIGFSSYLDTSKFDNSYSFIDFKFCITLSLFDQTRSFSMISHN